LFVLSIASGFGVHPLSYPIVTGVFVPGLMQPGSQADYSRLRQNWIYKELYLPFLTRLARYLSAVAILIYGVSYRDKSPYREMLHLAYAIYS
jgi:hypothetical protein